MSRARVARWVLAVAMVVVALGFFVERGLHPAPPPTSAPAAGRAPPATAVPVGATAGAAHPGRPRPDGGPAARATVILSAPWGSGKGQLGQRHDPESMGQGPMSLVVDRAGVVILDNVNRRLARFDAQGRALAPIALDGDAAQDLARTGDRIAVLDRLHDKRVTVYDADGTAGATLPLAAAGFAEAAAVTGIFGDRDGALWAEREHGAWTRLADAAGAPDATHLTAPGRPTRAGSFVSAAIADRAGGRARVALFTALGSEPAWQATLDLGAPILFLALADADAAGRVYLGAHTGRESTAPPYAVTDESLTVVALGADGSEVGRLTLPAPPPREESFRDLYVGDDGTIYWMRRTAAGVVVEAYRI